MYDKRSQDEKNKAKEDLSVLDLHKKWLEREINKLESHEPVKGFEEIPLTMRQSEFSKGVLYFCKMSLENIKDLESTNPISNINKGESK